MGLLSLLRNPLRGKTASPPNVAGGTTSDGWDMLMGRMPWTSASTIWKPMTVAEMELAFARHPVVRACTKAIASAASVPRIELGVWDDEDWISIKRHPMLDLLNCPNRYYSRNDLIQYITARYILTGWGYLWKIRNVGRSATAELWPVPSSWVTPRAGQGTNLFSGFQVFGQNNIVPEEDMAFVSQIDPGTTSGSVSAMQAALHDYQLDLSRQDYQAEMLENLKIPGVGVKVERGLTPVQRADLKADFAEKFGKGKRGEPIILEGNGSVELINPLADMDWPGLTSLSETRLCVAFGVPPLVVHTRAGLDKATYSNYEQARRAFYVDTMAPHWVAIADGLTLGLLRREGEQELSFRFRYDELPEFQEDRDKKNLRTVARYTAGIISRDEARAEMGYEPDPEFNAAQDARDAAMNALATQAAEDKKAADEAATDKADPEEDPKKKDSKDEVKK